MCALAFSRCKLQDQKSRSTPARSRRRRLCPLTVFLVTKQNIIKEWSAAATVRPDRQPSQHRMQDLPFVGSMSSIKRDVKKKLRPQPEARFFLEIQPTVILLR